MKSFTSDDIKSIVDNLAHKGVYAEVVTKIVDGNITYDFRVQCRPTDERQYKLEIT